jgi:hypothetical protein
MNPPDQPTRPTEAHYQLAHQVRQYSTQESAAQLIADSQARAIAKQVEALAILTLRWDKVEKERNDLRAELISAHGENERLNDKLAEVRRELAAERARLDWLLLDNLTRFDDSFSHRTAIDAAMKGGAT